MVRAYYRTGSSLWWYLVQTRRLVPRAETQHLRADLKSFSHHTHIARCSSPVPHTTAIVQVDSKLKNACIKTSCQPAEIPSLLPEMSRARGCGLKSMSSLGRLGSGHLLLRDTKQRRPKGVVTKRDKFMDDPFDLKGVRQHHRGFMYSLTDYADLVTFSSDVQVAAGIHRWRIHHKELHNLELYNGVPSPQSLHYYNPLCKIEQPRNRVRLRLDAISSKAKRV